MLFRDINSLEVSNLNKECVKSRLRDSARVNIDEGKTLNHLIHMEERIIRLLKSLESQGEISEKKKKRFISIRF